MNNQFITKALWSAVYEAHTPNCYHNSALDQCFSILDKSERNKMVREAIMTLADEGQYSLLPYRISILRGQSMLDVSRTGRARELMDAQLKGTFTQIEDSPYKTYKPFEVQTGLWKVQGYQSYYYGTIGASGINGRIDRDNSDLIIIHTSDWRHLDIFVFRGLAGVQKQLDYLPEVMAYLKQM